MKLVTLNRLIRNEFPHYFLGENIDGGNESIVYYLPNENCTNKGIKTLALLIHLKILMNME